MASSELMAQLRLHLRLKRDVGLRLEFFFRKRLRYAQVREQRSAAKNRWEFSMNLESTFFKESSFLESRADSSPLNLLDMCYEWYFRGSLSLDTEDQQSKSTTSVLALVVIGSWESAVIIRTNYV